MPLITVQELNDAQLDAQSFEDIVNGAPDRANPGQNAGTVTTRLGRVIKTVSRAILDLLAWRGAWSSATTYGIGDLVSRLGSSYILVTASSLNQPPESNPTIWNLLAAAGATGATGPTGPAGPAGAPGGTVQAAEVAVSNWLLGTSGTTQGLNHIVFGTTAADAVINRVGVLCAVSASGGIFRSITDGNNWTVQTATPAIANGLLGLAFSPSLSRFVGVGQNGQIISSSDMGLTWISQITGVVTRNDVTWSPNLGIFAAAAGTNVTTSPDGITWTTQTVTGNTQVLNAIEWDDVRLRFIAVGNAGVVATSTNGTTWTLGTNLGAGINLISVSASNAGLFVIGGNSGQIWTSTDGTTFTARTNPTTASYIHGFWTGSTGLMVLVSLNGDVIHSTDNGVTWKYSGLMASAAGLPVLQAVAFNTITRRALAVGNAGVLFRSMAVNP